MMSLGNSRGKGSCLALAMRCGVSVTAMCVMGLSVPAMAQSTGTPTDGSQVNAAGETVGANQSSPTGSRAGPGTAGTSSVTSAPSAGSTAQNPLGEATTPGATAPAAPDAGQNGANDVVVTGIRQSLANAQNIKRNSDTVVDAITATDIGALPDRSVTEALQRVPGVEISRFAASNDPDHFSVEGSGVNVRGLNFVRSEFNGRDTFSAGIGGQAVNFADVPAELLGSVEVYKNATADLIEGGLAGTVNLNTRKPFDNKGLHIGADAEANYGDFEKKWSPTGSLLVSDTWHTAIGEMGLLVDGSYSRIRSRADGIQVTNIQTRDGALAQGSSSVGSALVCRQPLPGTTDTTTLPASSAGNRPVCGAASTPGADGLLDPAGTLYAPVGGQFRTQEFDRKRDGQAVAFQWKSNDENTLLTAQFLRSHTTNLTTEHTFETAPDLSEYNTFPYGCVQNIDGLAANGNNAARAECPVGTTRNYTYNAAGLFQSGYITQPGTYYRNSAGTYPTGGQQQSLAYDQTYDENTIKDYGLNLKIHPDNHLSINLDADYTEAQHDNLSAYVFGSLFSDQELNIAGDIPVVVPHKPLTVGSIPRVVGENDSQYFNDPQNEFWRAAMDHMEQSKGREYAFKADFDYKFDDGSFLKNLKFGARYADRTEDVRYSAYNWGALSEVWAGSGPVSFAQSPANSAFDNFSNFFRGATPGPTGGYYYTGNLIDGYNSSAAYFKQIGALWKANGSTSATWSPLAERAGVVAGTPFLPSEIQDVSQQDKDLYGQLNFATPGALFGNVRLSGNVGLRYVVSDVTSTGSIGAPTQTQTGTAQDYTARCQTTTSVVNGNTVVTQPGGVCTLGPAGYAELQAFSTGQTTRDVGRTNYGYFLPSANLKFGLSRDLIFRLAGSKVLTRPDLANIRNFLTVGFDSTGNQLSATAGNPYLKPATAWQFDATLEWYFGRVGQLSVDGFYKSIHNFFYQSITNRSITSNGITENVQVRGPANYDGYGKIKGAEVTYQQTFNFLPWLFSGLGTSLNYTFIDSSGLPNSFLNSGTPVSTSSIAKGNLPFEGLSKHNVNATLFYEKGPVSLRAAYNWRSQYLLTAADVIFPYTSIFQGASGQLDASGFLNVNKYVKIGFQGVNLTNTITKTYQAYISGNASALAPRSFFVNDRRYSFILRANF